MKISDFDLGKSEKPKRKHGDISWIRIASLVDR